MTLLQMCIHRNISGPPFEGNLLMQTLELQEIIEKKQSVESEQMNTITQLRNEIKYLKEVRDENFNLVKEIEDIKTIYDKENEEKEKMIKRMTRSMETLEKKVQEKQELMLKSGKSEKLKHCKNKKAAYKKWKDKLTGKKIS